MQTKVYLTRDEIAMQLRVTFPAAGMRVYGIPSSGTHIALMLNQMGLAVAVESPEYADFLVDDLVASGATREKWLAKYPKCGFYAPYTVDNTKAWDVFPWETEQHTDGQGVVTRLLQHIGEDPQREGLKDTPARVVRSWKELYGGYSMDPKTILGRVFDSDNSEMVVVKDITFYSTCEHHMLPIIGKAHVAYIPNGKVVGLSKLARVA